MVSRRAVLGTVSTGAVTGLAGCLFPGGFGSGPEQKAFVSNDTGGEYSDPQQFAFTMRVRRQPLDADIPDDGLTGESDDKLSDDRRRGLFADAEEVAVVGDTVQPDEFVTAYEVTRTGHFLFELRSFDGRCATMGTYETERNSDALIGPDAHFDFHGSDADLRCECPSGAG